MNYRDLTNRNSVLDAIAECKTLGREAFLRRYGFGKARTLLLIHEGQTYDSKAILGVAYGKQFGRPLGPNDFSGGQATVVPKLEELGFKCVAIDVDERSMAIAEEVPEEIWEGARRTVQVNSYERSPGARLSCIELHGNSCAICDFNFALTYGSQFEGFIHVHHLVPLSKIGVRYKVNAKEDLIPVCPNCHAVLHYGGKVRSPDDVRRLLRKAGAK